MRFILFTTNSLPGTLAIRAFVEEHHDKIAAVCVFPDVPAVLRRNRGRLLELARRVAWTQAWYKLLETRVFHWAQWLAGGPTPRRLAESRGIPFYSFQDPNQGEVAELIAASNPVAVFNVQPALLSEGTLRRAEGGFFNLHGALLPEFRGVANHFWVLIEGAARAGASVHRMEAKVDTGAVIAREEFEISPEDTVLSVQVKTHLLGGRLLGRAAAMLAAGASAPGRAAGSGAAPAEGTYRTFPGAADIARLRRRGRRILTLRQLWSLWRL